MAFSVTITLSSIIGSPGPYNLYSNVDGYTTAFEVGISASGGVIVSSNVPNDTTNIKIKSTAALCNYEITKSISGLPITPTPTATSTPTPTPTVTSTHTPTPTPTPTLNACVNCSTGWFTSGTTDNSFVLHTYCLDLSTASNGSTIYLNYDAKDRLNKFYIYNSTDATTVSGTNTGWVGGDLTCDPPYNSPGAANGSVSFTYNSSKTYELRVEIAPTSACSSTPGNDSYDVYIACGGGITVTPTVTTLNGVTSGNTLNEACVGGMNLTLYFSGASIQIGESLYLDSNLTQPVPAAYYYYPDYNTIYNVTNGSTGAVASTPSCPTPTPTTTFVGWSSSDLTIYGGPLAISLVDDDGYTACNSPEYVIGDGTMPTVPWYFYVYGTNIMDATEMVTLSSGFRSELVNNSIIYVKQKISGTFYYRKFQLNGSPGDTNVTATPVGTVAPC